MSIYMNLGSQTRTFEVHAILLYLKTMEDYILKEISKITLLLEALIGKTAMEPDKGYEIIKQEMMKELGLDTDEVIICGNPVGILAEKGFTNEEMDALASLLLSVKGSMSIYRQGQVEILNDHIREHFRSEGYLSMALWQ
jgi:hypothetical protein